jgi:hypothetical protein
MTGDRVVLEEGQKYCEMCDGFGELCTRCMFPSSECGCSDLYAVNWEDCDICDGVGVQEQAAGARGSEADR